MQFVELARKVAEDRRDGEEGQSLVEYGLIVALVAIGLIVGLNALTAGIAGVFTRIVGQLSGVG